MERRSEAYEEIGPTQRDPEYDLRARRKLLGPDEFQKIEPFSVIKTIDFTEGKDLEKLARIALKYLPLIYKEADGKRKASTGVFFVKGLLGEIQRVGYKLREGWTEMESREAVKYLGKIRKDIVKKVKDEGECGIFREIADSNRLLRKTLS